MDSASNHPNSSSRDRIYRCDAIVLRRLDLGETDRILTLLTDRHGKIRVIAKGVRRPATRLAAHLELFAETRIVLTKGRDLDIVTGAETIDLHVGLRSDLDALGSASHCVELVDRFLADHDVQPMVYRLLRSVLQMLDSGADAARVARLFEFEMLSQMGVRPELMACVVCGEPVHAETNRFSVRQGGMLCRNHAELDTGAMNVSLAAQKVMRLLARGGRSEYVALPIPEMVSNEVELVLGTCLKYQLERDLVSLKVSRRLSETLPAWDDQTSTK
jgi:DNA repair protein RecO (recombination protein O)